MDIFQAIKSGDLAKVKSFLDEGVDIDSSMEGLSGWAPLAFACTLGHLEVVQYLLKNGANCNIESYAGTTALMASSFYKKFQIVKLLLRHGANPAFKNCVGYTVLDYMSSKQHSIRLLFHKHSCLFEEKEKKFLQERKYRCCLGK